jgi:signal transduction histidine kinase
VRTPGGSGAGPLRHGKGGLRIFGGGVFKRFVVLDRLAERRLRAERLRLARELHDGLAQELALIALFLDHGETHDGALEGAAGRALDECRQMIAALRGQTRLEANGSLADALATLARRERVAIEAQLRVGTELDPQVQFELLRIVTEAVRNAVRHGGATRVEVDLGEDGGELVLRVTDNGSGFDAAGTSAARYGLVGMRERAERLGGALTVSSGDRGTEVELALGS